MANSGIHLLSAVSVQMVCITTATPVYPVLMANFGAVRPTLAAALSDKIGMASNALPAMAVESGISTSMAVNVHPISTGMAHNVSPVLPINFGMAIPASHVAMVKSGTMPLLSASAPQAISGMALTAYSLALLVKSQSQVSANVLLDYT